MELPAGIRAESGDVFSVREPELGQGASSPAGSSAPSPLARKRMIIEAAQRRRSTGGHDCGSEAEVGFLGKKLENQREVGADVGGDRSRCHVLSPEDHCNRRGFDDLNKTCDRNARATSAGGRGHGALAAFWPKARSTGITRNLRVFRPRFFRRASCRRSRRCS